MLCAVSKSKWAQNEINMSLRMAVCVISPSGIFKLLLSLRTALYINIFFFILFLSGFGWAETTSRALAMRKNSSGKCEKWRRRDIKKEKHIRSAHDTDYFAFFCVLAQSLHCGAGPAVVYGIWMVTKWLRPSALHIRGIYIIFFPLSGPHCLYRFLHSLITINNPLPFVCTRTATEGKKKTEKCSNRWELSQNEHHERNAQRKQSPIVACVLCRTIIFVTSGVARGAKQPKHTHTVEPYSMKREYAVYLWLCARGDPSPLTARHEETKKKK